jgi:S-(hydroxymethyl)glutathione dehydrogenase/alcohol dehydrogenase
MTESTEAAVLFELGQPLKIVDLAISPLKRGQVLVDMAYSGVCHSQINEVRGRRGPDKFLPHCLGHEGSGTVAAVASGVTKVKVGDRVVLSWIKGTGADVPGTVYDSADGPINSGAIATFMRRTVTCENRLVAISDDMPLAEAALLGCAVPTGAGIIINNAKMHPEQTLAVIGAGGIGLCAILAAAAIGVKKILAVDVLPQRLQAAKEFGATNVINAAGSDALAAIRALTCGGVDVCVEAAGTTMTMEMAFEAVRSGGGLCVLAGNPPAGELIRINPFSLIAGKRIAGTWGGESQTDRDIPLFVQMFFDRRLKLQSLVGKTYSLAQVNEAIDDLEAGKVLRPLIKLQ